MSDYSLPAALGALIGLAVGSLWFLVWRLIFTHRIRKDAVRRSLAVVSGKVSHVPTLGSPCFNFART